MVRLRLQRHGRKRLPYYHIVAADVRKPRDGRIIETIGKFNPMVDNDERLTLDIDKAVYWLKTGAQPSDTVRSLLKGEGVFYRLHLERWGKSADEIEESVTAWKEGKKDSGKKALTRNEKMKAQLKAEEEAVKKAEEEAAKAAEEAAKQAEADAKAAEEAAAAETKEEAATEEAATAEETAEAAEETKAEEAAEEAPAEETPAEGEEEKK